MKEVFFDARMLEKGGIGTYIRNLLPGLKNHFRLKVIIQKDLLQRLPWLNTYDLIFAKSSIYSIQEQLELPFLISKTDLFFSPHYNIPLAPIRAKKRIATIHDVYHLAYAHSLRLKERVYAKLVLNRAVRFSDQILTYSLFSQSEIVRYTGIAQEKIQVFSHGVDLNQFQGTENLSKTEQLLQRFNLPSKFFLFVGNLKPHKNLQVLIQAMSLLDREDISLVVIGKSEGMRNTVSIDDLCGQESVKNRILWLSDVSNQELPALYRLAEALIVPSVYEGFGLPVLEAMSAGCAVIASNGASLPEAGGAAALYASPDKPDQFAEAMAKLLDDPILKESMRASGYIQAGLFPMQKFIGAHIEAFERVFL